jgi:DNA-binding response OmpR family regulator
MTEKILVIDDEPFFCEVLCEILQEEGYQVALATSGIEALSTYRDYLPDKVLLDIRMPGKNGLEVLRELKAIDPEVCVIMVSAVSREETMKIFQDEGDLCYVPKPVDIYTLLGIIKETQRVR